jgi:hypothetical protein
VDLMPVDRPETSAGIAMSRAIMKAQAVNLL